MQKIADLVLKAKQGDVQSMETILKCFKPKVTAICREYFLLGADFDDILQEGMIGLYKAVNGYDLNKNNNFPKFASMCIHHQIQNAVKMANSKKNYPLNDYVSISVDGQVDGEDESPKIMLQADNSHTEQNSLNKESLRNIYTQIKDNLSTEQYKMLLMYLNGYSYSEIAGQFGVTNKNVDNQIQAIKRKLRVILKGELSC